MLFSRLKRVSYYNTVMNFSNIYNGLSVAIKSIYCWPVLEYVSNIENEKEMYNTD